jgi:hypothetical protein
MAQLPWLSMCIYTEFPQWHWLRWGAGLLWGEEASGQQLRVQRGGIWLDGRHPVHCPWVSVILVLNDAYSLLSVTDNITPFDVTDKCTSVVQTTNTPLGTELVILSWCDRYDYFILISLSWVYCLVFFLMSLSWPSCFLLVATNEWMNSRPSQAKVLTGGRRLAQSTSRRLPVH